MRASFGTFPSVYAQVNTPFLQCSDGCEWMVSDAFLWCFHIYAIYFVLSNEMCLIPFSIEDLFKLYWKNHDMNSLKGWGGWWNPPTSRNTVGILLRDFDIHRIMQTRVNLNMGDNRQETLLNYRFRFRFRPISFRSPIGEKKAKKE